MDEERDDDDRRKRSRRNGRDLRWFHPRRVDVTFVIGAGMFLFAGLTEHPADPTIVYASLVLMGLPLVDRLSGG